MVKHFKLGLSLPSFHFHLCCSERIFPKIPSPAATTTTTTSCMFSPLNPKAFEIHYPNFPNPPPSSPISKRHRHVTHPEDYYCHCQSPSKPTRNGSKGTPPSSTNTDWFSSEESEETESLLQSSSLDSSYDFGYPYMSSIRTKKKSFTVQKLKRLFMTCKGGEETNTHTVVACAPKCKSPLARGKVSESYAVVKRSDDPYEDFKSSMLEMILEKQMFDDKDLEQLLHCFLSLNSRHHHLVIIQAFSEIWKELIV